MFQSTPRAARSRETRALPRDVSIRPRGPEPGAQLQRAMVGVSIHAPRAGREDVEMTERRGANGLNPRPARRRTAHLHPDPAFACIVQSTPRALRRGNRCRLKRLVICSVFQSAPPRVSEPHAAPWHLKLLSPCFNPRPPRSAPDAQARFGGRVSGAVSVPAPARGRDLPHLRWPGRSAFQSTPPRRRTGRSPVRSSYAR